MMRWLLPLALLGFLSLVQALSSSGNRLLVILEDIAEKTKYGKYLADLEERQFSIDYETPKSPNVALFTLGARAYDHVVLLPTKAKALGPNLTPKIFLDFMNAGGNILLALTSSQSTPSTIISLLLELDIHLPADRSSYVVDHFNHDTISAAEQHDVILVPRPDTLRAGLTNFFKGTGKGGEVIALPRAVGQTLGNKSPLLSPVLKAPRTAYSYSPKEDAEGVNPDELFASGSQLSLVTVFQARNSARLSVLGSAELLEDSWSEKEVKRSVGLGGVGTDAKNVKTSNQAFVREVTGWTFNEVGVLKVANIEHHLNEKTEQDTILNPKIYRVKNDVTYSIALSQYLWDKWVPFTVPADDELQLEFSMLSPFHRRTLVASNSSGTTTTYSTSFRLPDQHGIFNFKINYKRPFFSNIEEKNTVTVRHFAHDEWPRSWVITNAWPWIGGISVTVIGWIAFVALWLYSKPVQNATTIKKGQ